jgi:hypothetical protein
MVTLSAARVCISALPADRLLQHNVVANDKLCDIIPHERRRSEHFDAIEGEPDWRKEGDDPRWFASVERYAALSAALVEYTVYRDERGDDRGGAAGGMRSVGCGQRSTACPPGWLWNRSLEAAINVFDRISRL